MEYATILLLLKKRRRPVVSVDDGLKSVLALVQASCFGQPQSGEL